MEGGKGWTTFMYYCKERRRGVTFEGLFGNTAISFDLYAIVGGWEVIFSEDRLNLELEADAYV